MTERPRMAHAPDESSAQLMPPAPRLPSVRAATPAPAPAPPPPRAPAPVVVPAVAATPPYGQWVAMHERFATSHLAFLAQQQELQNQFMTMRQSAAEELLGAFSAGLEGFTSAPVPAAPPQAVSAPLPLPPTPPTPRPAPKIAKPALHKELVEDSAPKPTPSPRDAPGALVPRYLQKDRITPTIKAQPKGLALDRAGLEVFASGKISKVYGPLFEEQDQYALQVRMPQPPLLLADRIPGIDAEPGVLGTGTLWSETDVREDSWYLHQARMPTGIMIESGQADLMLISYMGIDSIVKGARAYRLLGCELTFHEGGLPKPGDTLVYDIHVDGHAKQNDVRLFFFHYDCCIEGVPRLSVRSGQAGFFTYDELADSKGILWKPSDVEFGEDEQRVDPPAAPINHRSFTREQLELFGRGDAFACFGPGFERAAAHTRTPRIQHGDMLFMDEVTEFSPEGGPWGRGYLRAEQDIDPTLWFFEGHFKNDPCMPGTLMFEGCVQTMALYMAAMGFTLDRDGWLFEPVPDVTYKLRCRGQVGLTSKKLVYEIFVREVISGPTPMLFADLLCTVDGLGAFHCERMGLRLSPEWP
ncbi:MAG: 3-hydroxyacyl-[acyl-carrier-protein] dehydratase FabA, partial [Myxococcota bacterium]